MRIDPTILKLGGSVITFKDKPLTINKRAITRLATEIKQAEIEGLVIVHGGGSFGHPLAKRFEIKSGYRYSSQIMGFSKTHQVMISLNKIVLDAFIKGGIPAVTLQPSAFITTENGRILFIDTKNILKLLDLGITPVLYGDVVLDFKLGFTILSGDQLISSLASNIGATRIIIGVDVDGLYTVDPKIDSSASLIKNLSLRKLESLLHEITQSKVSDVTGGMLGKMLELSHAVKRGIKVIMVNALKPDNVFKALKSEEVIGTIVERYG